MPSRGSAQLRHPVAPRGPLGPTGTCPTVERKIRFGCHLPSQERKNLSNKTPFNSSLSVAGVGVPSPQIPGQRGNFPPTSKQNRAVLQGWTRRPCPAHLPACHLFWKVVVTVRHRTGPRGLPLPIIPVQSLLPPLAPYASCSAGELGDFPGADSLKVISPPRDME